MRLIFFGTPDFALPALDHLSREHQIALVVTAPPRARGRGQRLTPSPVGQRAAALGIPVLAPQRLDTAAVDAIRDAGADAACVVAYGKLLPPEVFEALLCINVHPSLLPRHRGAAPVPWTIWSGDRAAGVTIMRIVKELDAGPIFLQETCPLTGDETAGELLERTAVRGAELLSEALARHVAGTLDERPQVGEPTYARTLRPDDERLDFTRGALELSRQIRALSPRPGVRIEVPERGLVLRLLRAQPTPDPLGPGRIRAGREGLLVGTGSGALLVTELQPAGGRPQTGEALVRGRPWLDGLTVR